MHASRPEDTAEPPRLSAPLVSGPRRLPLALRGVLQAGVASACVLGAGLGLWARPGDLDTPGVADQAEAQVGERRIRIVMDEPPPPPVKAPLEVLPKPPPAAPPAFEPPPTKAAPKPPQAAKAPLASKPAPAKTVAITKAAKPAGVAKADPKPPARVPARLKLAEARAAAAQPARPAVAMEGKATAKPPPKTLTPKAPVKTAAPLTKAPAKSAAASKKPPGPATKPKVAAKAATAAPRIVPPPPRQARAAPPCARGSRSEALVCRDADLAAADRRLTRAYGRALAAGVPERRLQRQQARWMAAREQAAEEAPWAVRDVYEARISELEDEAAAFGD